jgi:hypothetical protein
MADKNQHIINKKETKEIKETKESNKYEEMIILVEKKLDFFRDVIQKTILHVQKNKMLNILGVSDVSVCIDKLTDINIKIKDLLELKITNTEMMINSLQIINNELSGLFKSYGTENLDDLLLICLGSNIKIHNNENEFNKLELLRKYFHPISYKVLNIKDIKEDNKCENIQKNDKNDKNDKYGKKKNNEDSFENKIINMECSDISSNYKLFHVKVYGLKVVIYNSHLKKGLTIYGIIDDVNIDLLNNKYIINKQNDILNNLDEENKTETFDKFISSLTIKDYLIHNSHHEIMNKFAGYMSQLNNIKQKTITQVVKEFIADDMYSRRLTIIQLLIKSSNYENQYLAYLLYDLLSNDSNGNIDTSEQTILFDSFPWLIKSYFKNAMKKTIQYTNDLSNFEINKIPLEQQICLLKASDSVKEKAMMKLKEVKAKSEDTGSKARQYLDGLLKIPFNIYRKEPILNLMEDIKTKFKDMCKKYKIHEKITSIPLKEKYTSIEILKYYNILKKEYEINGFNINKLMDFYVYGDKSTLVYNVNYINDILIKHNQKDKKIINYQSMKKEHIKETIKNLIISLYDNIETSSNNKEIINDIKLYYYKNAENELSKGWNGLDKELKTLNNDMSQISEYMSKVKNTLDKAVYGHEKAKKQIERIISQWINGKLDGYCFGFEGPAGLGKTSLAKRGLSDCLKDDKGNSRPFAMIQMGGDSNGSTLHGHNYTYVGSTWGSIVQILIDKKCMNPIIFIDEVDKISRTEHGREIVGILTHLLDPAQNDCFQDKYFTGIDLDLSKALFILSYNDVDAIDKILLDRVHRIKFNSLSIEDKLVICNRHLLPEIYEKMGLEEMIQIPDDVLKYVIEEYTCESGVRKLKEILFEIVSEINLDVLKNNNSDYEIPIKINIEDIKTKYFKDKREIIKRMVPNYSQVGFINGMYATALGTGGTLPIHAKFYPSDKFLDLKLTGLQQQVMQESMHVSLTIAWNLTSPERQAELRKIYDNQNNKFGINIHTGDGSIQKDGPSAGCAISCSIYSILNDIPIKPEFALTGEIQMSGEVTAIGGLNHKILGSIKANVKSFIYPKENQKDFEEFYEKYKDSEILNGIKFYPVEHINEALELILDK